MKARAFHGDAATKRKALAAARRQRDVGLRLGLSATRQTIGAHDVALYEERLGIPTALGVLENQLHALLPRRLARTFPVRFLECIPVGADLARVAGQMTAWVMRQILGVTEDAELRGVLDLAAVLIESGARNKKRWSELQDIAFVLGERRGLSVPAMVHFPASADPVDDWIRAAELSGAQADALVIACCDQLCALVAAAPVPPPRSPLVPNEERFVRALALRRSPRRLRQVPLPRAIAALLAQYDVPPALRAFVERHAYAGQVSWDNHDYSEAARIGSASPFYPDFLHVGLLRAGFLAVGSCNEGLIVVDMKHPDLVTGFMDDGPVCVEIDEGMNPRKCFSPTPFDVGTFFWLVALYSPSRNAQDAFPVDGYAAEEQAEIGWEKFDPTLER